VIASRKKSRNFTGTWLFFDLLSNDSVTLPTGTDTVIHLAANTASANSTQEDCEVNAAKKLIISAQEAGAKFIFVSSQTARSDAPTIYGRTKWCIEREVLSAGGWVVRPGQVYGGELRGLFGTLVDTVKRLPILPAFIPAPKVQPIHVVDLSMGLLHIAERSDTPSDVYCLAAPEPVMFAQFLAEVAKSRLRCSRIFVPIPVIAINALGELLRSKLGLERLRSLFDLPVMDTVADLKQLGLVLRPLCAGMHPSGNNRRRYLLREGLAMLNYVLEVRPGSSVLRRYVRAVENLRSGVALGLPTFFLVHPIFLSLLEQSSWSDKSIGAEFLWRLDAATILAEATQIGASRYLGLGSQQGLLKSLVLITVAVLNEIFWRILRVLTLPLIRLSLDRGAGVV
jgi:nucleoside-diphosphate-sugar epimerase